MKNKLPLKALIGTTGAVLLWSLWPANKDVPGELANDEAKSKGLVSMIQPISESQANETGVASGNLPVLASRSSESLDSNKVKDLQTRFKSANNLLDSGERNASVRAFESLISDYPSVIEPYLNLASIYASDSKLDEARSVLLKGFAANPEAGMLFDHLSDVNGALAAHSYKQAIDTKAARVAPALNLARADSVVTQIDQRQQIAYLKQQLSSQQSDEVSAAQSQRVQELEVQIERLIQSGNNESKNLKQQLVQANQQVADLSRSLSQTQEAEREAQARVVRAEQEASDNVSTLNQQLSEKQVALVSVEEKFDLQRKALVRAEQQLKRLQQLEKDNQQLTQDLAKAIAKHSENIQPVSAAPLVASPAETIEQESVAIGLVKRWALDWSAQNVDAYVSHYADNYSSSRSLSRKQWLAQRQVRLTNKEFINVQVSDFVVKDLGQQFSVTFRQYYQSNTVDDTVTKRLVFNKVGGDWSAAKIVNERLVSK